MIIARARIADDQNRDRSPRNDPADSHDELREVGGSTRPEDHSPAGSMG
jgi:hypothetical protein